MQITLNQLSQVVKDFSNTHGQIKGSCAFGELEEVSNQAIYKFPYLFAIVVPSNIDSQSVNISISFIVMDLVKEDLSNRMEVLSDTLSIITDFRAYLFDPKFDDQFNIQESIPIRPFLDRFTDNVSGWAFDVTFKIPDIKDRCAIPQ